MYLIILICFSEILNSLSINYKFIIIHIYGLKINYIINCIGSKLLVFISLFLYYNYWSMQFLSSKAT